ncbi:GNAT family N-acetyltransferase (plasmid) [Polymorphobacter megasporae]|nr:GNAT family N-acetyltransferase [Polymorphobacter megasporae]
MRPHDDDASGTVIPPFIRRCDENDVSVILAVINAAADAYRGVIPADRWREPYMPVEELRIEMAGGVVFAGYVQDGTLVGVMGIQRVRNVSLIRHAYVRPDVQGRGIGSKLIADLQSAGDRPCLIGTWAAATWAVHFYERHGFNLVPHEAIGPLLRAYWNVPDRQIDTSVVLAMPALSASAASQLIEASLDPRYVFAAR